MSVLVSGIGELVTNDPEVDGSPLGIITDGAVVIADDVVQWAGPATDAPPADERVDVGGRAVIPSFVDSHTHLVFAGDRADEFAARLTGAPYDGGGIGATVAATRWTSDDELRRLLAGRVLEMRRQGTGLLEIKSGYGLDTADEVRALRIAATVTDETTYLGAHVVPRDTDRAEYLRLVTGDMLDACAPFARWIDVFCEPASAHAFDGDEARAVLTAGRARGLELRVHGNQLSAGPGVQLAVELGAASVDHCTHLTDADVDALADGDTVATLLPGVEFSTRSPYPDAARLLDAGITVALASDCNPGTSYTSSMPFVIALAVRETGMTPAQALWAATAGGARALLRADVGRLVPGARADLTVLDAPSYLHLVYRPGVPIAHVLDLSPRTS